MLDVSAALGSPVVETALAIKERVSDSLVKIRSFLSLEIQLALVTTTISHHS